jgi:hypothetical protein
MDKWLKQKKTPNTYSAQILFLYLSKINISQKYERFTEEI